MSDFLTITNANELVRIAVDSLICVVADGDYSIIRTCDGEKRTVAIQLGIMEELIHRQLHSKEEEFVRIGKSLIVNLRFVHYIHPVKKQIILSDNHTFKFNFEASKEALRQLKEFLEKASEQ